MVVGMINEDQKHLLRIGFFIIFYVLILGLLRFTIGGNFFFFTLLWIVLYFYTEYFHVVILKPLDMRIGFLKGKLHILKYINKTLKNSKYGKNAGLSRGRNKSRA